MKLSKDKRGVFGLTAVQTFFAIILGIALLAYVIVIIMGTLSGTTILEQRSETAVNESVTTSPTTGLSATLATGGYNGGICGAITSIYNASHFVIATGNITQTDCSVVNASSAEEWGTTLKISYPYTANTVQQDNLNNILVNTSSGITGFFSSISPIYAILAVLVIILVLVVLVRVVQSPSRQETSIAL